MTNIPDPVREVSPTYIRDLEIHTIWFDREGHPLLDEDEAQLTSDLQALIAQHPTRQLTVCEFGFNEEVVILIVRKGGMCQVAISNSTRPMIPVYVGEDPKVAKQKFWDTISLHKDARK